MGREMVPRVMIKIPLAHKRPQGKLQNSITFHLLNSRCHYMAGILPIRRKTQNSESIN